MIKYIYQFVHIMIFTLSREHYTYIGIIWKVNTPTQKNEITNRFGKKQLCGKLAIWKLPKAFLSLLIKFSSKAYILK